MLETARHFLDEVRDSGAKPICLAVFDAAGHMVLHMRMHGTSLRAVDIAAAKARTAALMDITTSAVHQRLLQERLCLEDFCGAASTAIAGGVPLRLGNATLGGVGISGGKPEEDEVMALRLAALLMAPLQGEGNAPSAHGSSA